MPPGDNPTAVNKYIIILCADTQNYTVPTEIAPRLEVKYSLQCTKFHDTAFYQNRTKMHKYGQKHFKPLRNVWQSLYYRLFHITHLNGITRSSNPDVSQIGLEIQRSWIRAS
jgi:hypothetical protein